MGLAGLEKHSAKKLKRGVDTALLFEVVMGKVHEGFYRWFVLEEFTWQNFDQICKLL